MLGFLATRLGKWLAAAGAVIAGVLAIFMAGRREGRSQAQTDALKDSVKRQEKGREAAQDLHGADRDELVDRVRRNDGQW